MGNERQKIRGLEGALRGLIKLIKAVRYYPPAHPALRAAVEESRRAFAPLLAEGSPLICTVRREGFLLGETPVAPDNPQLQKLAQFLFARRLQSLTLLPDLSSNDLRAFARCLTLEPSELQRLGGLQEVMQEARISTIWTNEADLARILVRKQEIEARQQGAATGEEAAAPASEGAAAAGAPVAAPAPSSPPAATAEERDLARVLGELQRETSGQRFRLLLAELVPLVHLTLTETGRPLVLKALTFLCRTVADRQLDADRREGARQALEQLTADDVLDFLVAFLCTRGLREETRERILRILTFLREKVVRRLMDHLAEESDAQARKFLTEALVRQGGAALPVLAQYLADERWYVVRNAVAILGEIRVPEAAAQLSPLLAHRDLRVRREAIRALTRIGGPGALATLLRTAAEGEPELRLQALLSLGAMKDPAAVPTLLKLVRRPDPLLRRAEVRKEAIRALGEIGSAEAVPALLAVLGRRRLWGRARFDELRAAAAAALGEIGSPAAIPALQAAAEGRAAAVSRAAAQALRQFRKGEEHGAGPL